MRLIYDFPFATGPEADMFGVGGIGEVAEAVEAAGFWGMSLTEHPAPSAKWLNAGGHQTVDPFVALGYAAARTDSLRLLTYLTVGPYRNPLLLAKAAATLDLLSGGRMVLGVGTGYLRSEFRSLGVDFEERNALFDEMLDVLPLHWSGDVFDFEGRHFTAKGVQARPAPVQQPIPIWIGGNAKVTRRRVAERAHGWMPLIASPEVTATSRTSSIDGLADLGRMIEEVKAAAGARAPGMAFVSLYQDESLWAAPDADEERHRHRLGEMADVGVTHVVLGGPEGVDAAANRSWIATVGEKFS